MKKVILAYSGGLDTSCCIKWLKDRGFDVVCFSADIGNEFSPADLRNRAIKTGASQIYIKDLKEEFAWEYILPSLKASALYEGKYLLATALGRPLIAKHLVETAEKEKASYVAHGCTGKGNDQVRFEVTIGILNPRLSVIAPLREWELNSREEEIDYAKCNNIPIKSTKEKLYSIDKNLWGTSIEGGILEYLDKEPPKDSYYFVKPLDEIEDKEIYLKIEFEGGVPVKLNGEKMNFVALIEKLNQIGAKCGIGRTDLIEDRVVGIKSRETYESPAAWILYTAHRELENLTLDRETLSFKETVSLKYAQLVYQGLWFIVLKKALDHFVEETQKHVSGIVEIKLFRGHIVVTKRSSPYSLYNQGLATYSEKDTFDKKLAEGFIKIWGMPYKKIKN